MEIPDKIFETAVEQLQEILIKLKEVNQLTGAMARYEACKSNIKRYGWDYILTNFHPDVNIKDPAAIPLFEFYKFVYENMKQKGEIL